MKHVEKMRHRTRVSFVLSFIFMLFATVSYAQNVNVSGTVSDSFGPMVGASVAVEGTMQGAMTDLSGSFSLTDVQVGKTLIVSFVGFKTQKLLVENGKVYEIMMEEDRTLLDEVVVVGYEVKKKSVVTGAISGIDKEDLAKAKAQNAVSALAGRVSGVNVMSRSGAPGTTPTLIIRGVGTNGDSNPLYVVDGLQMGNLSSINPNDIESMEVLKDATSTAIYGARGANGVVLVTTKKGKAGKTSLTYDGYFGVQKARNLPELMNNVQYIDYVTNAVNASYTPEDAKSVLSKMALDPQYNTNWFDLIVDNATTQEHNLSFSSGTEKSTSLVSLGIVDQYGITGGDDSHFSRYTLRANGSYKITNFLSAGANVNLAYMKSANISAAENGINPFKNAAYMEPTLPPFGVNADEENFSATMSGGPKAANPLAHLKNTPKRDNNRMNMDGNVWLEVAPIEGLTLRSSLSVSMNNVYNRSYSPKYYHTTNDQRDLSMVENASNLSRGWQWENTALYRKSFGEHNFSLLLGQSALMNEYQFFNAKRTNILEEAVTNENYHYLNAGDVATSTNSGGANARHTMASYFGRLSYNYKERYLLEGVVRRDASSNFGPKNKWGTFPGLSAGWNISNEDFWDVEEINSLKLRASWGQNGNESITPFSYTSMMSSIYNYPFGDKNYSLGTTTNSTTNRDVKWETSEQINIGVDMMLLNGKLNFTADWFNKKTKDLLFQPTVSTTQGTNSASFYNIGQISNRGFEFLIRYRDNIGDFNYSVSANLSTLDNKTDFINTKNGFITGGNHNNATFDLTRMSAGHAIGYLYLFKTDGIFQSQEEIDAYVNSDGVAYQPNAKPGDYKRVDVNENGVIDDEDRADCGNPWAKYTYGATINMDYKGFDFTVQMMAKTGFSVYPAHISPQTIGVNNLPLVYYENSWRPDNRDAKYAQITTSAGDTNNNWTRPADVMVEDGDYFSINLIELGYSLPKNLLKKALLSNVRVYVAMDNPLTLQSYYGTIPESGRDLMSTGLDYLNYPLSRTTRVGLNLTF